MNSEQVVVHPMFQEQVDRIKRSEEHCQTKWEYYITDSVYNPEKEFNKLGDEGWELVSIRSDWACFKRPKLKKLEKGEIERMSRVGESWIAIRK